MKKYVENWERNIENFNYIEELKETILEKDRIKLNIKKLSGLEMARNFKKEMQDLIESHKDNILKINKGFEEASVELIRFEEQRVFEGLKKKLLL